MFTESPPDRFQRAARSVAMTASVGKRVPMQTPAIRYDLLRHRLEDGEQTTVYVVRYARPQTSLSVQHFAVPQALDRWCRQVGVREAIVGGFFVRPHGPPLGELWIGGRRVETEPVLHPYGGARAAIYVDGGKIHIGPRAQLPSCPAGHLLQAGPMLVRDGTPLRELDDPEGFVAGSHQFDSDITSGRHPRAAFGTSDDELIALVCDGRRTGIDAGLTLTELAELIADLGAHRAINLDGGGSTALIHHGHLLNRPYEVQDQPSLNARAIVTAAIFHTPATQSAVRGAA
jgi:Phosphodiester glycosidase